jgi:two-component system, OmpR family, sensor kinase
VNRRVVVGLLPFGLPARRPRSCAPDLRLPAPRTLRGHLTLTNVCLLGAGLVLTAVVSLFWMNRVLMGEVDHSLRVKHEGIAHAPFTSGNLDAVCRIAAAVEQASGGGTDPESFGQDPFLVRDPAGRASPACRTLVGQTGTASSLLARAVHDPVALADSGRPTTVHAGGTYYRVVAARLKDGTIVVAGVRVNGVRHAVHKVLIVEVVLGAGLLALLAALSMAGARRKLRPLEDMVRTASAIAEGDLSRRVGVDNGSAEVSELGTALNSMLHQIEGAFQTRERANTRLRQFVADASHELRTPLASIRGYLQLWEKGMLDGEEEGRALARVASEAERMSHLVDELLVLARLDQRPALCLAPVDLAALARDGAADLLAQQPDRPVEVRAPKPVVVLGEEAQLRKVVANLLSNVRTHTPERCAVTVEVLASGRTAVLGIADTGPGMRPSDAARVFDRFFRADPDRARLTGGSGLGMSIVQAVVEAHRGTAELSTAPGEGLAVQIRLPLHEPAPRDAAVTTSARESILPGSAGRGTTATT